MLELPQRRWLCARLNARRSSSDERHLVQFFLRRRSDMESQLFSAASLSALLAIVLIDLVLAGDNALVIGLAARNLPRQAQRKVIFWGTFVAIAVRALMAILVVYILALPGFMLA